MPSLCKLPPTSQPIPLSCQKALFELLHHTANSHWLSILCICICFNVTVSIPPSLSFTHCTHKCVLYVYISIAAPQIGLSVPSFSLALLLIAFWFSFTKPFLDQPFSSVQFSSVAQSCPTLCNPKNCSTPGLPIHHQLLEFNQTHFHWVGDAISSFAAPFAFCLQSFPASGSFPL